MLRGTTGVGSTGRIVGRTPSVGDDGSVSRRYIGVLPATACACRCRRRSQGWRDALNGMAYTLYEGMPPGTTRANEIVGRSGTPSTIRVQEQGECVRLRLLDAFKRPLTSLKTIRASAAAGARLSFPENRGTGR
jgi:hypothetical protein